MSGYIGSVKNLRSHLCSSVFICVHLWLKFNQDSVQTILSSQKSKEGRASGITKKAGG
ncbi:hypothetical protein [Planktothrix sp. FACHB-1355]|uniref:hypothetical protein n=1 Tax=Planktothrix sp. FACHB-1355 TaxID=2692854 RepID=UPI00168B65FA|nr:hypothetical protein [Planktothrix sp. FACHB-1355]